jgi:hypothetical protein
MKLRLSILAVLFFALLSPVANAQFTDIQKDSLTYMYHQGIIDGYDDGTFRPAANINRAELIKLLMISAQITPPEGDKCFTDVSGTTWYVKWVCAAKEKGWVGGYADGSFRPENAVNRAEAAKIIVNVLGIQADDIETETGDTKARHTFTDVPAGSWFYPYVNALTGNYFIDWNKTFAPNKSITREEVAEIIFRNILAQKLYGPMVVQGIFANRSYDQKTLTEAESLALAARDFFRDTAFIQTLSYDQLAQAQTEVDQEYAYMKEHYADSKLDFEQWNYRVWMEEGTFTYGVLGFHAPGKEMTGYWRDSYVSWAVLKFDTASKKLLAYDFFTRNVDQPSLVPNIVSVKDGVVTIALGKQWPDPTLMYKDGDHLTFQLRDIR